MDVAKLLASFIVAGGPIVGALSTTKITSYLVIGSPADGLRTVKILPELVFSPSPLLLTVHKALPELIVGPAPDVASVHKVQPGFIVGPNRDTLSVMKVGCYFITYVPSTEDLFMPPPPTIESQVTFASEVVDAGITDEWDDTGDYGLNATAGKYDLFWKVLYPDEVDYMNEFLTARAGTRPFKYTIPTESTEKIFKCSVWEVIYTGGTYSMKAELRQVFDLKKWNK